MVTVSIGNCRHLKGGGLLKWKKMANFVSVMVTTYCIPSLKQVIRDSFEQHTSLPYLDLQVSFRGNFPQGELQDVTLSATLLGK